MGRKEVYKKTNSTNKIAMAKNRTNTISTTTTSKIFTTRSGTTKTWRTKEDSGDKPEYGEDEDEYDEIYIAWPIRSNLTNLTTFCLLD